MQPVTLCFLISSNDRVTDHVCLALKKTGFGAHKWAGIGGKVEAAIGETVEQAARRELREEIMVEATELEYVAEIAFVFRCQPAWNLFAHVYLVRAWRGEPAETAEMRPRWFATDAIPYDAMWADAKHWLPRVLAGERLRAQFTFASEGEIEDVRIKALSPSDLFPAIMP